jgi:predicted amidohydrolase YtcJ
VRPGYLADITVFDRDLRTMAPNDLHTARVDATIQAGTVVYERR